MTGEEQWRWLAKSQTYIINDLASLCQELIDELKVSRDTVEIEKILEQIKGEVVRFYEFEDRKTNSNC